ncbi:hypothetical protein CBER1_09362 [Cercospora berteroae]|uniref:Major facilitator superfamily (MFS) profile domain-containing protein n=1 Tax=Cercospora berteroae TaxID=357750 RepID=A0A2S6BWV3_9PEZI|nr:hypothetical protein CBER1_09362 [Cercospora berteroae]
MQDFLGLRGQSLSHAIALVTGLIFFLYGYDQGLMGGFLTMPGFFRQFPRIDLADDPEDLPKVRMISFTVAAWNLGCFLSAMIAVFIGDRVGRRKMVIIGLALLLIGEVMQCASFVWGQFLAGRLIAGIGNGFNCATMPAWQAECTKAHRRGTLLMISAGATTAAGMTMAYWVDFAFAWLEPSSAAWRVPIALQVGLIFLAAGIVAFMPESPRWLILQGREAQALKILGALNNTDSNTRDVHQEFLQIKDAVIEMAGASFSNLFKSGDYRDCHRVILAVVLQFSSQLCGIVFMTQYYAAMFQQQYLWGDWEARLLAAGAGTAFFLASFIAVFCIDRICGRRALLMFGTSGMLFCMIILTIMLKIHTRPSLDAGTAFIWLFCCAWAIGWQGISWLYQVEIVPLRIRGPANALSTGANWLGNFTVVIVGPVAFATSTWKSYIIFIATNAAILPMIYFLYPETSMRCLEEVDYIFFTANSSPRPWLDVRKAAADLPLWYGAGDEETPYDYEASEWHQRHVRFSDEVEDSEGDVTTLGPASGVRPEKARSDSSGSSSEDEKKSEIYSDGTAPVSFVQALSEGRARSQSRGRRH